MYYLMNCDMKSRDRWMSTCRDTYIHFITRVDGFGQIFRSCIVLAMLCSTARNAVRTDLTRGSGILLSVCSLFST